MAEPLPTLIKLATHKVEKMQRQIMATQSEMAAIDRRVAELLAEVERGGKVAAELANATVFGQAAAFADRARGIEEDLKNQRLLLEQRLAAEQETLGTYFAEQKRYETLWQRKQQKLKKAHEAKQQAQLDEAAGVGDWMRRGV